MVTIRNQLVASRAQTWPGTNRATSITIHETANTSRGADAQAHANLQSNGNVRQASWHIQVDGRQAIRSFPDTVRCWHAGRSAEDSIAIEICVNSDGDYDRALVNAADVVRQLRAAHGLGRSALRTHHDWTGKHCPTRLRSSGRWSQFVASTDPHEDDDMTPEQSRKLDELHAAMVDGNDVFRRAGDDLRLIRLALRAIAAKLGLRVRYSKDVPDRVDT